MTATRAVRVAREAWAEIRARNNMAAPTRVRVRVRVALVEAVEVTPMGAPVRVAMVEAAEEVEATPMGAPVKVETLVETLTVATRAPEVLILMGAETSPAVEEAAEEAAEE